MILKVYEDIGRVAQEVAAQQSAAAASDAEAFPILNYNTKPNSFLRRNEANKSWEFTGFELPEGTAGAGFGFYLIHYEKVLNRSGLITGRNLVMQFWYYEYLDTNLYNPQIIQARGLTFTEAVINNLKKCGLYIPTSLLHHAEDCEGAEQYASLYTDVIFSYVAKAL